MKAKHLLIALAFAATSASAQYPTRPITSVVGFAPGGGTDTVSRIVAKTLGDQLGQQVLTDNKAGAGGNIATDHVVRAAPDGYTIYLANVGALTVNPHLLQLTYDPLKDLAPITMAVVFPNLVVVHPSVPASTLAEGPLHHARHRVGAAAGSEAHHQGDGAARILSERRRGGEGKDAEQQPGFHHTTPPLCRSSICFSP